MVPFRVLEGSVKHVLLEALGASDVDVAVVGARATSGGRRPVGRTTAHIIEHLDKPVVLVPPEVEAPISIRRILVPLEGAEGIVSNRSANNCVRSWWPRPSSSFSTCSPKPPCRRC